MYSLDARQKEDRDRTHEEHKKGRNSNSTEAARINCPDVSTKEAGNGIFVRVMSKELIHHKHWCRCF